jgi:hypothetical protein
VFGILFALNDAVIKPASHASSGTNVQSTALPKPKKSL